MIGKLTGVVDSVDGDGLILDVGGVGYRVQCGPRLLARLPKPGGRLSLAIEMLLRDEEIRLFGFESEMERRWFRALQTVQGVGARVALAILGVLTPTELARAVTFGDKAMVGRAPGVGPKLALRIVTELKDRAPAPPLGAGLSAAATEVEPTAADQALTDALSALVNLGYGQSEAARALATVAAGEAGDKGDVAALIRAGLQELAR